MKHFGLRGLWLLCFLSVQGGCAAVWGSVHLTEANKAVSLAEEAKASEFASYEYTMAQHYLQESKERYNRSDYRASVDLAKLAGEWAEKAKRQISGDSPDDPAEELPEEAVDDPPEQELP